ncbi:MAG: hypothetical protein AAF870_04375, partial [Pseudomonadota bacterium]
AFAMKGHSHEDRAAWANERVASYLELDSAQQEAFSKVTDSYLEIRGTGPEFLLDLSGKLQELAADNTLTTDEVNELREQIKAEFDRRADLIVPEFVEFYNGLDDSQRDTVMARLEKMSERISERNDRYQAQ